MRTSREDLFSSLAALGITRTPRLDRRVPAASAHAVVDYLGCAGPPRTHTPNGCVGGRQTQQLRWCRVKKEESKFKSPLWGVWCTSSTRITSSTGDAFNAKSIVHEDETSWSTRSWLSLQAHVNRAAARGGQKRSRPSSVRPARHGAGGRRRRLAN